MNEANRALPLDEMVRRWTTENLIGSADVERVRAYFVCEDVERANPWYLRVLAGVGAWVAALCFIAVLAILGVFGEGHVVVVWGAVFVGAAIVLRRVTGGDFGAQFALALSVAGHIAVLVWAEENASLPLVAILLCALVYPLYRDGTHRFLSCAGTLLLCAGWLAFESYLDEARFAGRHLLVLVEAAGVCVLFTTRGACGRGRSPALRPLAYALAAALVGTLLFDAGGWATSGTTAGYKIILTACLLYACVWATGRTWARAVQMDEPLALALVAVLALGIVSAPGVLAAGLLLVVGYARHDTLLVGLGTAFFPVFIWFFYYTLAADLLTKSFLLFASGIVLLLLRYFAARRSWAAAGAGARSEV